MTIRHIGIATTLCASLGLINTAQATETGGGVYPNGAENYLAGALPPPGLYELTYLTQYSANRFNDGNGHSGFLPDFKVRAEALVSRTVYVSDKTFMGANWGGHLIVPLVDLEVDAAGVNDHRRGVGDITVNPLIMGWHFDNGLHLTTGLDINVPIGSYDRNAQANFSRHYWNFEPVVAFAYYDPDGFALDMKFMYDFNQKNTSAQITGLNPTGSDYRSGQELHVDFAAGYNIDQWQVGVSGYYYKQTTDDHVSDRATQDVIDSLDGLKGQAFALGPAIRYNAGPAQIIATWQHEFESEYRPQGERLWLKFIIPFGK
ncbi:SphA family protein [Pseudomonas gingeri]